MSLPEIAYLAWALERYGRVRFDLATSGLAALPVEALGAPSDVFAGTNDPRVVERYLSAIASRFDVPRDAVVPTLGTTHGLFCAYAALVSRGDEVLVESPTYEPLVRLAEALGARAVPFVRDVERSAAIDVDEVGRLITPRTKLIVVSNLHNPTGAYVDDHVLRALAANAARSSGHLLVDEVYRDLRDDADARRSPTAFHLASNVVTTSSLTKVYGLPWARAGWVLARGAVAANARTAGLHTMGAMSGALASAGAYAFARFTEVHALSKLARANHVAAAARLSAFVEARPHLVWRPEPGAIFGFVIDRRGRDLRPVIERAIDEHGVIVAPGSFFGMPSAFRIRYGAIPTELLEEGLARLGRVLDA